MLAIHVRFFNDKAFYGFLYYWFQSKIAYGH